MKHFKSLLLVVLSLLVVGTLTACDKLPFGKKTTDVVSQTTTEVAKTTTSKSKETTKSSTSKSKETTKSTTEVVEPFEPGVTYSGSKSGEFVYDQTKKIYTLDITLAEWGNISITYEKDENTSITLWYNTCTVSGDVTSESANGADWTYKLYHEDEVTAWYCCMKDGAEYKFEYDPALNTLKVEVVLQEEEEGEEPTDEKFDNAKFVAKYNEVSDKYAMVFDSSYTQEIELSEYTIATNADGKIIFASRTSSGYGGPADGFYNDGNYSWTAGQVCGIFDLSTEFAGWTEENKDDKPSPWTLYSIVCPTGYHIITGSKAAMAKLIKLVTGVESFDANGNNALFENETADGSLNKYTFTYTTGTCCCGITFEEEAAPLTLITSTDATAITAMTKDETTGTWTGVYKFHKWNSISFVYGGKTVWYDEFDITGDVTAADKTGCDWTKNLYHESDKAWFHDGNRDDDYYKFTFDGETLTITQFVPGLTANTNGETVIALALNEGKWTGTYKLTGWNNIAFNYVNENNTSTTIWYDNTEISGVVTDAQKVGSTYDEKLYHEETDGKKWIHYSNVGDVTYTFVYDPVAKTLVISTEAVEVIEGAKLVGKLNVSDSMYVRIYDSTYTGEIVLGEYTIATNADGKIIFASRTSSGYAGPADGFYHDGNYVCTAGQVCGIFDVDANFTPWSATYSGPDPKPWTLYSIVCPTGYHIITGSQAQLTELVKALTGVESFTETNNLLFENTVVNGTLNKYILTYVAGTSFYGVKVKEKSGLVATGGTVVSAFTENETTGVWTGTYALTGWGSIALTYDGVTVWYDNTTITGTVTDSATEGCAWNQNLYHENKEGKKWFHYGEISDQIYIFTYNPTENTLVVASYTPGMVVTGGTAVSAFAKEETTGVWTGTYTLSGWGSIALTYDGTTVWYDNTTVTGHVTDSATYGCPWSTALFHEQTDGKVWIHYGDIADTTYTFTYNPTEKTLLIAVYVEKELSVTTAATVISPMTLQYDGTFVGTYKLSGWGNISFTYGDTVVWYDNTTITGHVTDSATNGCQWNTKLFHEQTDGKVWIHYGDIADTSYTFAYNPITGTLLITVYVEKELSVTTAATVISPMTLQYDGTFVGTYKFTGWNNISFTYGDTVVWYDNTTVTGHVTDSATNGCSWTTALFHEQTDGKVWIHYGDIADTAYTFTYNPAKGTLLIVVYVEKELTVATAATAITPMTLQYDGTFVGTYKFTGWNNISFTYGDTVVWYDNTTFSGEVVDESTNGCQWNTKLFHEQTDGKVLIHTEDVGDTYYKFVYNPGANTLVITKYTPGLTATGGVQVKAFSKNGNVINGAYSLSGWNTIGFTYVDENGNSKTIWYDNTTVTGDVTTADTTGCAWNVKLFHEVANGKVWLHNGERPTDYYKFGYNPAENTLVITNYIPGLVATGGTAVSAFAEDEITGIWTGIYTLSGWDSLILAYDGITVWYDNTTISGDVTASDADGCSWGTSLYHELKEGSKWYHYGEIADTTYAFAYNPAKGTLAITIYAEKELTVTTTATAITAMTLQTNGTFVGTYKFTGWNNISFTYDDTVVWYDNTAFFGEVVDESTTGCQWNTKLFHEETDGKVLIHTNDVGETCYRFIYNPIANTLVITKYTPGFVVTGGTAVSAFTKDEATGAWTGTYTLSGWGSIGLVYTDENGFAKTIWYDNTTVSGNVTDAETTGCAWSQDLYHEDGKVWYHYGDKPDQTYTFVFNPTTNTLTISFAE